MVTDGIKLEEDDNYDDLMNELDEMDKNPEKIVADLPAPPLTVPEVPKVVEKPQVPRVAELE